jgi:hypothetical protein
MGRLQLATEMVPALLKKLGILGEEVTPGIKTMVTSLQEQREAAKLAGTKKYMEGEEFISPTEVKKIREDQPTTMMQHVSPYKLEGGTSFDESRFGTGEGEAAFGPGFYTTIAEGENPISKYYENMFGRRKGAYETEKGPLKDTELVEATKPARAAASKTLQAAGGLPMRSFHLINDYMKAVKQGIGAEEYLLNLKMKGVPDEELLTVAAGIEKLPASFQFKNPQVSRYDVLFTDDLNKAVNLDTTIGEQEPWVREALARAERRMPGATDWWHTNPQGGMYGGAKNLTQAGLKTDPATIAGLQEAMPGRINRQVDILSRPQQSASIVHGNDPLGRFSAEDRRKAMKAEGVPGGHFGSGSILQVGAENWTEKFRNFVGYDASKLLIIRRHGIKGALAAGMITPEMADQLREIGAPEEPEEL